MSGLRVMSFNLRRDGDADGDNAWPRRRDAAASVVRDAQPDVLGAQELLPHQLADLDARLPSYARVGGCRRGTGQDEHTPIFWRRDRFDLVEAGDVWLSDTPDVAGSTTWGNELPRMATWARLRDRRDGTETTFVNTHFDHRSEMARLRSAKMLATRFPTAVLMGDFNAHPDGNVHASFRMAGFSDAGWDTGGGTYHGFTGFGTMRIDWVLVPEGFEARSHRILRDRPLGRCPSDHDPVLVELVRVDATRRVPVQAAAPESAETAVPTAPAGSTVTAATPTPGAPAAALGKQE